LLANDHIFIQNRRPAERGRAARAVAHEGNPMSAQPAGGAARNLRAIRWLTYLMFFMFAMTTDSVGVIIPQVIAEFQLSMTAAGALHYGSMSAIALAGLGLGFLADRLGRKRSILLGLALFSAAAFLYPSMRSFPELLALMMVSGAAIGIFKTGALALVGDLSNSTTEHTRTMNLVEGCFGVGAIVGPFLVTQLAQAGVSWRWLYVVAGSLCVLLLLIAAAARYPAPARPAAPRAAPPAAAGRGGGALALLRDPYAMGFSLAAFSYVAVECAIYVWMPTLLTDYHGPATLLALYALPVFFTLRAAGRFLGAWLLGHFEWSLAIALCSAAILACFAGSLAGGVDAAVYLLPLAGLFTSIIYPTINSKGIGCFATTQHGCVAGVILFFTCAGAALGPLAMGAVSDAFGGARYGFVLATGFATLLAIGLTLNWIHKPAHARLAGGHR
jgi:fucose permease